MNRCPDFRNAKILLFSLFLLVFISPIYSQGYVRNFFHNDTRREYIIHVPKITNADFSFPVFFFLHGLGDNIRHLDTTLNFQSMADKYKWIIVLPQALDYEEEILGKRIILGTMWNAGMKASCFGFQRELNRDVDDVDFLMSLYETIHTYIPYANDSLFFAGFSMGGFMTHRIALEYSDKITAFASISGLLSTTLKNKKPASAVNFLQIHGTKDEIVSPKGKTSMLTGRQNIKIALSLNKTMSFWKQNNSSDELTIDSLQNRKDDSLSFVLHIYSSKKNNKKIEYLEVIGGTHTLYTDVDSFGINYFDFIYDFFVH